MERRFLVFTLFAIVTQSSVDLSSATFDGFSEEGFAVLNQLTSDYLAARSKSVIGWNSFFNLLKNGAAQKSLNPSRSSGNVDLTAVAEALSTVGVTSDIIFHSALTVIGNCDLYESALNESRARLNASFATFISEIASAQGASASNSSQTRISSTGPTLFELLRSCVKDYSDDLEDLIEYVEGILRVNFGVITTAVREAIETYGSVVSGKNLDDEEAFAALLSLEKNRATVIAAVTDNLRNIFSLYEASFVNSYLNGTDIVPKVFSVRLARKIISTKLEEVVEVVFVPIREKLLEYTNDTGTGSGCVRDELVVTNACEAVAVGSLLAANSHFLQTVSLALPNSTDSIAAAELILPHFLSVVIDLFYYGIGLAEDTISRHPLNLWRIESVRELQTLFADFVIEKYFEAIGSEASTEARLAKVHKRVVDNLREADQAIFRAIGKLAKAVRAIEGANQGDFHEVCDYQKKAISAINNVATFQLYAILYKLIVDSGY